MELSKINSLVELYFKKAQEVDEKKPFLKWLKSDEPMYNWEDITQKIFKLTLKIKSIIKLCLLFSKVKNFYYFV